jgi:hypothetical protein
MIIRDLYMANANSFIDELRGRARRISNQAQLSKDGGDFQETVFAYHGLVANCLAEAEAYHARILEQIEDDETPTEALSLHFYPLQRQLLEGLPVTDAEAADMLAELRRMAKEAG